MDSATRVDVNDTAHLTLETGFVSRIDSDPGTTVTITGGTLGQLGEVLSSVVRGYFEMSGGLVRGPGLHVSGEMIMSGGSIETPFTGDSTSSILMTGGSFQNSGSTVFNGSLDIFGGFFGSSSRQLTVGATGTVEVFGSLFTLDGIPITPGMVTALSGVLAGVYESGSAFSWRFTRNPTGTLSLIPEPGTAWLLGAGLAGLALRRRSLR